ncbi:MAG TPA: AMP-binding protein [Nonomuraea sp.]|nr:AMP-binding protein [Nonomuraea sp.]
MLRLLAGAAARRFGARAAVVTGSTCLTFADLDRLSDEVAAGLAHRGARMGDVVALALPDGPEFVICYVAAAKIGAAAAGVGTERLELLASLDPAVVITVPRVLPPLAGLDVVTLPVDRGGGQASHDTAHDASHDAAHDPVHSPAHSPAYDPARLAGLRRAEPPPPPFPPDPARPVVIAFTAGRTGPAKGVVFGNRQLEAIRAYGAGDRWGGGGARVVPCPLGRLGFVTRLPVFLQAGRTCHVLPSWSADGVLRVMRAYGIDVLEGTPYQLGRILAGGGELPGLALIRSGGAPAPAELIRALRDRYGVPVCNRYVCTEAGLGVGTRPCDPPEDAEVSVGRPRGGVSVSIRDGHGHVLPPGEPGEVFLRSAAVMSGYAGDGGERTVFAKDGFVRTGDRGYIDDTGRLRLVGRLARAAGS